MIGNTSLFDKHKNNLLLFFVFILISNNVYSDNMIIDDIENSKIIKFFDGKLYAQKEKK